MIGHAKGVVLVAGSLLLLSSYAPAATFTVTKTADTNDGTCDADCSLREAVIAANANPGPDTITVPAGTYLLTLPGTGEDGAATGDLDLTGATTISGAGALLTVVDGNGLDRVFDIHIGAAVTMSGVTIQGGSEITGGGIRNFNDLTLLDSVVAGNAATGDGGGIANFDVLVVERSEIRGNTASNDGGGVLNLDTATFRDSTVSGNTSSNGDGGGISNSNLLTLEQVTVSGNTAKFGGGISNFGTVNASNSTIVSNSVPTSGNGGGIAHFGLQTAVSSTIVANNTPGNCNTTITSNDHNLDSGSTCGFTQPNDLSNTAPALAPLADNGGPTRTHALCVAAGVPDTSCGGPSPAIDRGSCALGTDQRGEVRHVDGNGDTQLGCDIGAYEASCAELEGAICDTDGVFCSQVGLCSSGACDESAGSPCPGSDCRATCNETARNCFDPSGAACSDDGNACTEDVCDGAGVCVHNDLPDGTNCDDGVTCNGTDKCVGGQCFHSDSCVERNPIDHFKCYVPKPVPGAPKFARTTVTLSDQFLANRQTEVIRPFVFCNPVNKNGSGIDNPIDHLMCYKIRDVKGQTKFAGKSWTSTDQLAELQVRTKREKLLCVPALKSNVGPFK